MESNQSGRELGLLYEDATISQTVNTSFFGESVVVPVAGLFAGRVTPMRHSGFRGVDIVNGAVNLHHTARVFGTRIAFRSENGLDPARSSPAAPWRKRDPQFFPGRSFDRPNFCEPATAKRGGAHNLPVAEP
jgi:hypothetical protein